MRVCVSAEERGWGPFYKSLPLKLHIYPSKQHSAKLSTGTRVEVLILRLPVPVPIDQYRYPSSLPQKLESPLFPTFIWRIGARPCVPAPNTNIPHFGTGTQPWYLNSRVHIFQSLHCISVPNPSISTQRKICNLADYILSSLFSRLVCAKNTQMLSTNLTGTYLISYRNFIIAEVRYITMCVIRDLKCSVFKWQGV